MGNMTRELSLKYTKQKMDARQNHECPVCKQFFLKHKKQVFCSRKCWRKNYWAVNHDQNRTRTEATRLKREAQAQGN